MNKAGAVDYKFEPINQMKKTKKIEGHRVVIGLWLSTVLATILISLLPDGAPVIGSFQAPWSDLAHMPAYALLAILTILSVAVRIQISIRVLILVVLVVILFGVLLEAMQSLTDRTASFLDVGWNSAGAVLAACGYYAWHFRQRTVANVLSQKKNDRSGSISE